MNDFAAAMRRGLDVNYEKSGDRAHYINHAGLKTECTVMVERDVSVYGDVANVTIDSVAINVRVTEVARRPKRNETFCLLDSGETFTTIQTISSDDLEHKVLAS